MTEKRTVLYTGESDFGAYKVVDMTYNERPARMLFGESSSPQSGVAKDDDPHLLFDYNQRFLEIAMSMRPKKVLVIGGGAFMLPTALFHRFPAMRIDVVEIDPLLVQIAHDYFNLPESKRLRVFTVDGAEFIAHTKERYDLIIIDAFSGFTIPQQLLTKNALHLYKKHLKRNGVVALNFISEYKPRRFRLAHELLNSFSEVFNSVELYQADPSYVQGPEQNHLLAASDKPLQFDYLQSSEVARFN